MNAEKGQEGRETVQQVKKERKETEKKDRNTILMHLLRQRSRSVGSIDTLNKKKGEEENRREAERDLLRKFEKTRGVTRISPKKDRTESNKQNLRNKEDGNT